MSSSWIVLLLLLTPPPHSAPEAQVLSAVVREADDAELACPHAVRDPGSCRDPVWTLNDSPDPVAISERRSTTASCSLLINDVTVEDGGVYGCETPQRNRTHIVLSVVSIVECKSHRFVTLECSVSAGPPHRVEWQGFERETDVFPKQSPRFASVSFSTAHPVHAARTYEFWRCHVKDNITSQEHVFTYNPKYPEKTTTTTSEDRTLDGLMVALRSAELLLLVFIGVLLFRSRGKRSRPSEHQDVHAPARFSQAANQVTMDGDKLPANYENV